MMIRSTAFVASLALLVALAGCGRQIGTAATHEVLFAPAAVVKPIVVPKALIHEAAKPVKGVVIEGRVYPAGSAPTIKATPAPAAPEAGKGHLHVTIDLANKLSFCERMTLTVRRKGQDEPAYTKSYDKSEFVGLALDTTATNLEPGDYSVTRESIAEFGRVFDRDVQPASVEASKTLDLKL